MLSNVDSKKLIIIANWKMNPIHYNQATELFDLYIKKININKINLIISPPVIYLKLLNKLIIKNNINISLSAQNICWEEDGAFTGEVSANMVKTLGCRYTIIGHSERRKYNKETDLLISKKFLLALKTKLIPIVCIGETKTQFDKGEFEIKRTLDKQLNFILKHAIKESTNLGFLIAYEPVWAIGTGISADLQYINKICGYIRKKINHLIAVKQNVKILYGGSVNPSNAKSIFELPNVDGALVGGASLDVAKFSAILDL